jgi:hypothetical protein
MTSADRVVLTGANHGIRQALAEEAHRRSTKTVSAAPGPAPERRLGQAPGSGCGDSGVSGWSLSAGRHAGGAVTRKTREDRYV